MSINLQKGQKIDLTKGSAGLKHIMVGLGWDEAEQASKGILGIFNKPRPIDCDASAILCNENGKFIELVYYGNLKLFDESVPILDRINQFTDDSEIYYQFKEDDWGSPGYGVTASLCCRFRKAGC